MVAGRLLGVHFCVTRRVGGAFSRFLDSVTACGLSYGVAVLQRYWPWQIACCRALRSARARILAAFCAKVAALLL